MTKNEVKHLEEVMNLKFAALNKRIDELESKQNKFQSGFLNIGSFIKNRPIETTVIALAIWGESLLEAVKNIAPKILGGILG